MVSLTPDLDRDDRFQLVNSLYSLSYYAYHQAYVLLFISVVGLVLLPMLEARVNASSLTQWVMKTATLVIALWITSTLIEAYVLDLVKSKLREAPHIRQASIPANLALGCLPIIVFPVLGFGIGQESVLELVVASDNLLLAGKTYRGLFEVVRSALGTVAYSSLVFFSLSGVIRAVSIVYYNLRL